MSSARRPMVLLLIVLGVSGLISLWLHARGNAGIDFYQMWAGARIARETSEFYSPATAVQAGEEYVRRAATEERSPRRLAVAKYRRRLELVSTPFLYMLYAPLRGSYERDLLLFHLVAVAALIGAVALLARALGLGVTLALTLFALLTNAFEPVASDLRVANGMQLIFLLIACVATLAVRRNMLGSGALLTVAGLAKPYFLLLFPLLYGTWILQRRWRDLGAHALGAAIAGVAGLAASMAYFRSASIWGDWLQAFRDMPRSMVPLDLGNVALARLVQDGWSLNLSVPVLVLAMGIAIAAAARSAATRERVDWTVIGLGCLIALLASPLVWVHYLILSIPLLASLLRPAGEGEPLAAARGRQIAAAVAIAILAIEPWAQFVPTMTQVAALVNVGLVIAFTAGVIDLRTRELA